MNLPRLAALTYCLLGLWAATSAQRLDSFRTATPEAFAEDLSTYMNAGKRESSRKLTNAFDDRVGAYGKPQFARISAVANDMLSRGMSVVPYFEDYLAALAAVPFRAEYESTFDDWFASVEIVLSKVEKRDFKGYKDFLRFSTGFFTDRTIRKSGGLRWIALSDTYGIDIVDGDPRITFDTLTLRAVRRTDSIQITGTSGTYYPSKSRFVGRGGEVDWRRYGLDDTYAVLSDYDIDATKALYKADSVTLTYPSLFGDTRIEGGFVDKITSGQGQGAGNYPHFTAYAEEVELTNLGEGVTYRGGVRIEGLNVLGQTPDGPYAIVELKNEGGKVVFRGASDAYVIRQGNRIVADQVRSTFYHGVDSIFHPSATFRYDIPEKLITLTRGDRAGDRYPFYASLQDVNIEVDEIKVYGDRDTVILGEEKIAIAKTSNTVVIESLQYFDAKDYNKYQNIATYNPLTVMRAVAENEGREINGLELARKIDSRFSIDAVEGLYFDLMADGFIDYDTRTQQVRIKDKLIHFVDASQGKVDYDALALRSKTAKTNARLDLTTGDMAVAGVRNLELSRKQRVAMVPEGGDIVMSSNRNIDFDGTLFAGYTVLEGEGLHFEYEPYLVRLDSIGYFDIFVPQDIPEEGGKQPPPEGLTSRIEDLSGVILIDAPKNKSGREEIEIFPSLQTESPSYVYYDLPSNNDTAYHRDSFYFEIGPINFNSLDKFSDADVRFAGRMYPADIFDPYDSEVYIREADRSLGHTFQTPPGGMPTYGGAGTYVGELDLSNRGYVGEGTLNYLNASVSSNDFKFLPRRMTSTAKAFDMAENRTAEPFTPKAVGTDVSLDWRPFSDSMYVQSEEAPFALFADTSHQLEGQLILTPSGLKAQGAHDWNKATIRSELISYGPDFFESDTMAIAIKTGDGSGVALEADNLAGRTDIAAQRGSYSANGGTVNVNLPTTAYSTVMNTIDWDIAGDEVTFTNSGGEPGRFVSTSAEGDSLFFDGTTATYLLNGASLRVGGVPFIASADARITPADGRIKVGADGRIAEIANARIVADTVSEYHVIDSATVNILGRSDYTASGYYRYDLPDRQQRVRLDDIVGAPLPAEVALADDDAKKKGKTKSRRPRRRAITKASGDIAEADDFYVDPRTRFYGTISFETDRPTLTFNGFAKLGAPNIEGLSWFSVNTTGDKDELRINYDLPQSPRGDNLSTGIFLSRESLEAYPRLFMPAHSAQDRAILDLNAGLLAYDPAHNSYLVGDSARVNGSDNRGGRMSVDVNTGTVTADGPLTIGDGLDYVSVKTAGKLSTGFTKVPGKDKRFMFPEMDAEVMMGVDLIIPDKLLNLVAADIQAASFDAPDVDYAAMEAFTKLALPNWLDEDVETSPAALLAIQQGGFALPKDDLEHSFVFPRIPMRYNGEYQSFVSTEDVLDLAYVNGTPINKRVEAYVEVKTPGSGDDRLYVYIKSPSQAWYFFGFKQGILNVVSSSPRFMEAFDDLKKSEYTQKMKDGELYEIAPVNVSTATGFIQRVKEAR